MQNNNKFGGLTNLELILLITFQNQLKQVKQKMMRKRLKDYTIK